MDTEKQLTKKLESQQNYKLNNNSHNWRRINLLNNYREENNNTKHKNNKCNIRYNITLYGHHNQCNSYRISYCQ